MKEAIEYLLSKEFPTFAIVKQDTTVYLVKGIKDDQVHLELADKPVIRKPIEDILDIAGFEHSKSKKFPHGKLAGRTQQTKHLGFQHVSFLNQRKTIRYYKTAEQ